MAGVSKWWKCDLQVATPAWDFSMPAGADYDLASAEGKAAFAARYVDELIAKGIEVVAIADHNTGEWIDVMVDEGRKKGVTVFPGCEITTGTGADGIHAIVIGDLGKTSRDFDVLLGGVIGFRDPDYPRYHENGGKRVPASSSKTLTAILDDLPDDYLVIAPHAFGDNGIASRDTATGDIRWRALHHSRLSAIDVGTPDDTGNTGHFKGRFQRRELNDFPCLKHIAFVATSDSYSLDDIGTRFSWIRMETPTLEALRQAFLDHEARILCSWDPRLNEFPDMDPNKVRHSWISGVTLSGELGNSDQPLSVNFHQGLNTLIGGRGSGKSTIVAAIRQLYSSSNSLPASVKDEFDGFADAVFKRAQLQSEHFLPNSQERRLAQWDASTGQTTVTTAGTIGTAFNVRVINQKELFERVSKDRVDPFSASRSFLAFVDEGLGLLRSNAPKSGTWWRRFEDARQDWTHKTSELLRLEQDIEQLPSIRLRIQELEAQVSALDSDEARARRMSIDTRMSEMAELDGRAHLLGTLISRAHRIVQDARGESRQEPHEGLAKATTENAGALPSPFDELLHRLADIQDSLIAGIDAAAQHAESELERHRAERTESTWGKTYAEAVADNERYLSELQSKGINPDEYSALKASLAQQQTLGRELAAKEATLVTARQQCEEAWQAIQFLLDERRRVRSELLNGVSMRSGRLRFSLKPHRDIIGWVNAIRELLNLRSDSFLEDVPALARWLWEAPEGDRADRWHAWRIALAAGRFDELFGGDRSIVRGEWIKRLERLDGTIRLRLAGEIADDTIEIAFLKNDGRPERDEDWQDITRGSPGQRTAAMLGFVLHHGDEPLVLDQPEDDLDTEWISELVVRELRASRWKRQVIVVTHNANIPVNGDAEQVIVLENRSGAIRVRETSGVRHAGALENGLVRQDIQNIMEGGIRAFIQRERKYGNDDSSFSV